MAASTALSSGIAIRQFHCKAMRRTSLSVFPESTIKLQNAKIRRLPQPKLNGRIQRRPFLPLALASDGYDISLNSASEAITQFYDGINEKNLKKLDKLLSDNCFCEDFSFIKPFQGKQELMKFLEQLIASMGQNMEFKVDHICEGDDLTAAVKWHLEWKKKQVPFTRGCSYYELSRDRERLLIERIQVVIESPIKPGALSLALLKMITSIFDAFPEPAERFLKSPNVIFQLLLKVYNIIAQPILNPILSWYIKLWSFIVNIISFTLKILKYIVKFINIAAIYNSRENSKKRPYIINIQSSVLSRFNHESNNVRATNGPTTGGSGGGLLKATIGSAGLASSFSSLPPAGSSVSSFLGIKVRTVQFIESEFCLV
ncbi:OLC1v1029825C1 [Oldenlandia corymbosa var. corymbosa]|uniref:OLC1v1029825C1 n=1 Tax=Oldenlandia corymbosa var. corymbosa TaxID=529605 RepID=A0AAV1CEL5_OLDCO|nr:OLC1v1029825C1 [Oldenlandia corymbosa var. corymbosa]